MTIVLEKYRDTNGNIANIEQEKHSSLFTLAICRPYTDDPHRVQTIMKREYMSKESAKKAMRKNGETWTKIL